MTPLEFPKLLKRPDGTCLVVNDEAEQAAALADGWYLRGTLPAPAIADDAGRDLR